MCPGMIFDIKKFAVHDGPGIRTTVFFKGCPLSCWWCHNPEGISSSNEIFYHGIKCINCGKCIQICPEEAVIEENDGISILRKKCTSCGLCGEVCPSGALQVVGRKVTVEEIMKEIRGSVIYYDSSNGGVTFSGGEPLMQPTFLKTLLKRCKEEEIHTTLDTAGYASPEAFNSITDDVDLFLYDLKLLNSEQHLKYTGVSNKPIIKNLKRLIEKNSDLIIRFPVIPTITDTEKNIEQLVELVSSLRIHRIDLLPFHDIREKYERLGKEYRMESTQSPSNETLKKIREKLESNGIKVKIGG
ncbi:MAG: glycyl-radical enzyme activating protein [Euryarchaeota archaeon]|nr:glycyl-radical enzyme activating protein [Euryarchaeota archaeon]